MVITDLTDITLRTDNYNFHSHTQYCDGRFPMSVMADAAAEAGMEVWGFSPHAPICIGSPCNMSRESVPDYLDEAARIREEQAQRMRVLAAMEVDFISPDFGPHIDYFQRLPLDYRIGSVHFVPNQDGVPLDCDGRFERFAEYLRDGYAGDLRYVVEKYFEQVLTMLERGGFEILGHFDKIAGNAAGADPRIEEQGWYEALVDDVISHARRSGVLVEINTKALFERDRFYPALRWWDKIKEAGVPVCFNSDAHYADKVNLGRPEAIKRYNSQKE